MNRAHYFDYIEEKLTHLATRVALRGKLNILDLHIHSENFYLYFFNELFGWKLQNLNAIKPNATAIDLIDQTNNIVVQVSATATKNKVESALTKDLSAYAGYAFKFISISKDAGALRSMKFANPHSLTFAPQTDIYDIASILNVILALDIDDQRRIADFIKKELGSEVEPQKLESNLAAIINILAREDWCKAVSSDASLPFDIDKKIDFNNLDAARGIIDDYNVHHGRVAKIYAEFDKAGANKSTSVLAAIRSDYFAHMAQLSDDALFFKIVECVADRVKKQPNCLHLPVEELDLCVNILVVDSFLRCKIFKNPEGYVNAAS